MSQPSAHPEWVKKMKAFQNPSLPKAIWQLSNTMIPLVLVWGLSVWTFQAGWNYLITLGLMALSALLVVRLFIFFHDCTHGSYFKSSQANGFWGFILGVLTFTPYDDWRQSHGTHHNTSGNLDLRGVGDVWTLTVEEYRKSTPWVRFWYRIYRNPLVLFLIIPPLLFIVLHRFPHHNARGKAIFSVIITDLGIVALLGAIAWIFGWTTLVCVHIPMFYIASIVGVWLFYVQHQFDPGYWERTEEWDFVESSLLGSSHYKLPKILQWFTGNIGLHHIHHVRPGIPNYNLQACYDQTPELQLKDPMTFWKSLKSLHMHLWDEANKRLLSFRQARRLLTQPSQA